MNNYPGRMKLAAILASLTLLVSVGGCQQNQNSDSTDPAQPDQVQWQAQNPGLSGQQIVNGMRQAYANADRYADKATLHLSYRLQGGYLEEPHAWEVQFDRQRGVEADLFEARFKADQNELTCFIFDFGSGNLDNQYQIHPIKQGQLPWNRFFLDGICRHYITGQDELPINKQNPLAMDVFFPPTLGLLAGDNKHAWLDSPQVQRLADVEVDGWDCYQIRITYQNADWLVSIDTKTNLLRRIDFPLSLLDQRLQDNPDVENLEVFAKFSGASFTPDLPADQFVVNVPEKAKRVSHFVAVPEPFPCDRVGKAVPELGLRDSSDQPYSQRDWQGKVTLLCWTGNMAQEAMMVESLNQVAAELSAKDYSLHRVEVIDGNLPGDPDVAEHLANLSTETTQSLLADYSFTSGETIGLKRHPVLAVIDRQGILQYVKFLDEQIPTAAELQSLLTRVRSGDNIAQEMRQEYEAFLDVYHERLADATIDKRSYQDDGRLVKPNLPQVLTAKKLWSNDGLQQPGNIRRDRSTQNTRFTLLDGWRTVIQLDVNGKEIQRDELELDTRETISVIRQGDKQAGLKIVYSVMGKTIHVLDESLQPIANYRVHESTQRIREARLFDFDNDQQDELIVSTTGQRGTEIFEIESLTGNAEPKKTISEKSFRSSTVIKQNDGTRVLVFCDHQAKLQQFPSTSPQPTIVDCDLVAAVQVNAATDTQGTAVLCVIGTDHQGRWSAIGLDENLQQTWSVPIGNQRFDTQIESVTYAHLPGQRAGLWAIAAANGSIKLISDDGRLVDNWDVGSPLHGIELIPSSDNQYLLVLSTDDQVQGWTLSTKNIATRPASAGN